MTEMTPVQVSDSYENTEELIRKFPVIHPTPVLTPMEQAIRNRLLNGFENWNRGYEAWEAWGDILYTPDSIYNVHAVRLTLKEYQQSMKATLRSNTILMGDFKNMVIVDDWCAIHYEIATINRKSGIRTDGSVMEFVNFRDYGGSLGTRVVEGWAGTKGADYDGLGYFQTQEERLAQKAMMDGVAATVIPDTEDLIQKYPVLHPTSIRTEKEAQIRQAVFEDFEHYNQGADSWCAWADSYYAADLAHHTDDGTMNLDALKAQTADLLAGPAPVKRVYFDSMLISGDWAAIHYRTVCASPNGKEAGSRMQFLHFADTEGGLKVTECWTK